MDPESSDLSGRGVHLLPGFDEYLLGYTDRSASLAPDHAPKVAPGSNGQFMPTIVKDGRVIGLWKRLITKKAVSVTAEPFGALKKTDTKAFEKATNRYRDYLGGAT
jgi:hypothetical protein